MSRLNPILNSAVAAFYAAFRISAFCVLVLGTVGAMGIRGVFAESTAEPATEMEYLLDQLAQSDPTRWKALEDEIWTMWSTSGSDAMDLLLERGRAAMIDGDLPQAVEHLTALVDHAPDFAEGYNARATAYFQQGAYGPAMADIQQVLLREPRHFGALAGLGLILEETGHAEDALTVYERALAVHPHRPDVQDAVARLAKQIEGAEI